MLKYLLYLTGINTTIMVFTAMEAVYSIYRYTKPLDPSQTLAITAFATISAGEPFLFFVSASYLSILRQNFKTCITCCKRDRAAAEGQHVDVTNDNAQTNPASCPINQPSHTYFSVPYTGAFTEVTEHNENKEKAPLLMHK